MRDAIKRFKHTSAYGTADVTHVYDDATDQELHIVGFVTMPNGQRREHVNSEQVIDGVSDEKQKEWLDGVIAWVAQRS